MASENETVDEVFAEAMNRKAVRDYRMGISNGMKINVVRCAEDVVDYYAMRFRDSHKREVAELERKVAELRECLKEAIQEKCPFLRMRCKHGELCDYECGTFKWRKALKGASND